MPEILPEFYSRLGCDKTMGNVIVARQLRDLTMVVDKEILHHFASHLYASNNNLWWSVRGPMVFNLTPWIVDVSYMHTVPAILRVSNYWD